MIAILKTMKSPSSPFFFRNPDAKHVSFLHGLMVNLRVKSCVNLFCASVESEKSRFGLDALNSKH